MTVPLGSKGQADFSEPIELMMDCHRRIEHFFDVLGQVVARYADQSLDDQAREALTTALNYFASAAPRHTADEEQSLFPRMRQSDDPAVRQAMAQIDQLESDHRLAEVAHARLDHLGRQWLTLGALPAPNLAEFRRLLDEMATAYGRHIPIEDQCVFVLAKRALSPEQLQTIGMEMKQRRIQDPGRPGSRCANRRKLHLPSHEAADV